MGTPLPVGSDGTYLATVAEHIVDEKESGSIQLEARFLLTHQWNTVLNDWEPIAAQDFNVFGNVNLRGRSDKGGVMNVRNISVLQEVTQGAWETFADLYSLDMTETTFMITCKTKVGDDGVERIKAEWLDAPRAKPGRSGGGVFKKDEGPAKTLAKYNSELKALRKKPAADAPPMFRPKQPEPGSQAWDTPARGTTTVSDDVPF